MRPDAAAVRRETEQRLGGVSDFGLAGLWAVVAAIAGVQVVWSVLYLRWFRVGPLEWLLRRLSYGVSPLPIAPPVIRT